MKYLSTRGGSERLTFEEAVLTGLAPNGGLFIPAEVPQLPANWESEWANLSFPELSHRVLSLYIPEDPAQGGIPSADLQQVINKSYSTFRHQDTTPLVRLDDKEWCLELWHGPTFAFKDVALQLLGNLFEYFLQRRNKGKPEDQREKLTIVGATSGDTGSAAIQGVRSKEDISIFILFPDGRVSPIQEAQMTTVLDDNVHNVSVQGTFDDCQDVVKALFSDADFNAKHRLGAVNSINWARILAQIVYYFSAYFSFRKQLGLSASEPTPKDLEFVVPTGNFGDILAGYYAKRMGLPVSRLVVATNENDILQRFWATGRYEKSSASPTNVASSAQTEPAQGSSDGAQQGGVRATLSPAMDILVSSNFERLLWYIAYESQSSANSSLSQVEKEEAAGKQLASWMHSLKTEGRMVVDDAQLALARRDFAAERVSDSEIRDTVLEYFTRKPTQAYPSGSYLVDPHTAVGFKAAANVVASSGSKPHQIVLSTAHPAKFAEAVTSSLESAGAQFDFERDVLPKEMVGLLEKERRVINVKPEGATGVEGLVNAVKKVVESQAEVVKARAVGANTASV
ncbi:probable THR4 - threonine synthase (o-p-homoserine p-lyase) [Ustilago trichophora]|uniref:threonine synthase n=1 Tax=Ustilago trichophora TaxID=86804 RepID=A0A5C3EMJ8_9BASI|nr:probable THR4 - threonine synthase (o-p-homoserine p-lyase) [Ustilago trichophora]